MAAILEPEVEEPLSLVPIKSESSSESLLSSAPFESSSLIVTPCILCGNRRNDNRVSAGTEVMAEWIRSSAIALCQLLQINENQFLPLFSTGTYCRKCFLLCNDIDFSMKQMSSLERRVRKLQETAKTVIAMCYADNPRKTTQNVADESFSLLQKLGKEFKISDLEMKRTRSGKRPLRVIFQDDNENHSDFDAEDNFNEYKLDPDYFDADADNSGNGDNGEQHVGSVKTRQASTHKKKKKYPSNIPGNIDCAVPECKERFTSPMKLKLHVRTIHENDPNPYHCEFPHCTRRFPILTDWLSHYDEHKNSDGKYQCIVEGCAKAFKKRRNLTQHLDTRHIPRKKFKSSVSQSDSESAQPQMPRILCEICSLSFDGDKSEALKEHEALHRSRVPFSCVVVPCNAMLMNLSELKLHVALQHEEVKFICPSCPEKVFRNPILLNFHIQKICGRRKKDPEVYRCQFPNCGKMLANSTNLNIHMKLHTAERDYICDQCGSSYKQKKGLVRHKLMSHNTETPHKCLYCVRAFPTVTQLRTHEETHSTERNFLCSGCGKSFGCKANLRQHTTYFCQLRPDLSRKQPKSKRKQMDSEPKDVHKGKLPPKSTISCSRDNTETDFITADIAGI